MIQTTTKTCTRCGAAKPIEDFHRNRLRPDGRMSWCKSCVRTYQRKYRIEHQAEISAYQREYHDTNKGVINVNKRTHYKANKEAVLVRAWSYREKHKETVLAKKLVHRNKNKHIWLGVFWQKWNNITARTINSTNPRWGNPYTRKYYLDKGVRLDMTRDEFKHWCYQRRELIEYLYSLSKEHWPEIHRKDSNGHYAISNIQLLPKSEHQKLHIKERVNSR